MFQMIRPLGQAFGATFHADGADIDLVVAPEQLTGGPYFLTGNAVGSKIGVFVGFEEVPPGVGKNAGLDKDDVGNFQRRKCEGHNLERREDNG